MGFWGSATDNIMGGGQGKAAGDIGKGYSNSIGSYNASLDKITKLFQPWMDRGNMAGDKMMGIGDDEMAQFRNMMGNGEGGTGDWMTQYKESPWAKYQSDLGTQAAEAAASAGGMLGSGSNMRDLDTLSQDISSKDRQQYFEDAQQLASGASGNYSPLMSTGAGLTGQLGDFNFGTGKEIGEAQQGMGQAKGMDDLAHSAAINNMINMGMYGPTGSPMSLFGGGSGNAWSSSGAGKGGSGGSGGSNAGLLASLMAML